ncbi:MAG: ABC transporter permease [Vicinamibacterales bacterium]
MRLYRALLRLYPRSFRHEYGVEMAAIFAARRREAGSIPARLAVWISALVEIAGNAARVHADLLRQDAVQVARLFARAPGFVLTAVAIVGLGIGATTAAFSVTDYVLFRPLPFPDAGQLVRLWESRPGYGHMELSPANMRDWMARQSSFTAMDVYTSTAANVTGTGDPRRVSGALTGVTLFDVLGVSPARGRGFIAADGVLEAPPVVILSYAFWQTRYGGAEVIGRVIRLDDVPHEIVGVMPASFAFPSRQTEFWLPLRLSPEAFQDRNDNFLVGVARLRDDVTIDRARDDLGRVTAQLEAEHPAENRQAGANVERLRDGFSDETRNLVIALIGAAACLLVITCVNLVNLLLARVMARRTELVVRAAMGAGRERLVRQLTTETVALAAVGGLVGLGVASAAVPLFSSLVPVSLPFATPPHLDWRVLAFAAALTLATGLATGILPLLGPRQADFTILREGGRGGGGARERVRAGLVTVSLVSSVVLLVGGGLLLRAIWAVQSIDPGFRTDGVLTMRTALPVPKYADTERRIRWITDVVDGIRAIPGVRNAAYTSFLPMVMGGGIWPVVMDGDEVARQQGQVASLRFVTPGYFDTLGIPLLQGRDVSARDTLDQPAVAVVSRAFAERYWPGEPALGRRFTFAFTEREVVGVVGDIRVRGFEEPSEPQVYLSAAQQPGDSLSFYMPKDLAVRVEAGGDTVIPAVRRVIAQADADQPISDVRWMSDVVAGETASRVVQFRVIAAFAGVALLLAGVGIHGLLAYVVSQRHREIGVRMALGAQRSEILAMVMRRAAWLAVAGVGAGVIIGYGAGRSLESVLAGVPANDPATYLTAALVVALVALAGALVPALRATRVDPVRAMRAE